MNEQELRDYFAAAALTGLVAHVMGFEGFEETVKRVAEDAYSLADAMLKERNRDEH